MKVLVFIPTTVNAGARILDELETALGADEVEVVQSLDALSDRLREPLDQSTVAVLAAETEGDLNGLISISALLSDVRTVLLLPNSEESTVAKGHSLWPRVVGWGPDFARQIPPIVKKMLASPLIDSG
jgi:hypothetical protein